MTTDYKALAERANECLQQWEALEAWDISIEPWSFLEVLRTVVTLLNGMAQEKPAMWAQSNHVSWAGMQPFMARCAPTQLHPDFVPLFTRPAPQPQPERQPVSAMDADDWAELHRLRAEAKGPDGHATWKEAAVAERVRRVEAERLLTERQPVSEPTEAQIDARDALLDFISENGTASEGVQHYLDRYVRAALAAK